MATSALAVLCAIVSQSLAQSVILDTPECDPDVVDDCVAIELENLSEVRINPLTGDLIAVPAAPDACMGGELCDAVVELSPLSLSQTAVDQGSTVSVSYTQRGAYECRRSGLPGTSWNTTSFVNPNAQSVTADVVIPADQEPIEYTLLLECRNGVAGPMAQRQVTAQLQVDESGTVPAGCENFNGALRPTTWNQEENGNASNTTLQTETWADLFQSDFPLGSTINMRVRNNRYLALSFNPGTAGTKGAISFTDLTGDIIGVEESPALVSMTACPGDFRPQSGSAVNCRRPEIGGLNGAFRWSRLASDQINRCVLDSQADLLYFNVTYVGNATETGPAPNELQWRCRPDNPDDTCGHRLQPSVQ